MNIYDSIILYIEMNKYIIEFFLFVISYIYDIYIMNIYVIYTKYIYIYFIYYIYVLIS